MELFKILIHYSNLGYDITLTSIVGHEGIRMVKRYSHKAERSLVCEQISEHHKLLDKNVYKKQYNTYMMILRIKKKLELINKQQKNI